MVRTFNLLDRVLNFSAERYLRTAGDLFVYDGDYESALAMVDKTLEIEPDDLRALVLRGDILYCMNRDQEALEHFNEVLALDPGYVEAYISKAGVLDAIGRHREALEYCAKAFELVKREHHYLLPSLYDLKILLLIHLKRYREANRFLSEAQHVLTEDEYHFLLGSYRDTLERACRARSKVLERARSLSIQVLPSNSTS